MSDAILVLNAGSSSIKFSLFPGHEQPTRQDLICDGEFEGIGQRVHFAAKDGAGSIAHRRASAGGRNARGCARGICFAGSNEPFRKHQLIAAGHRVVHGGSLYTEPVVSMKSVIAELRRLIPLAPLHQPHHLAAIAALSKLHPSLPQIACFDTSFHHTQPEVASIFALPRNLTEEGVRRYGFHGLSYEYIASVLPDVIGPAARRGAWSSPISATAPACARCTIGKASQPPWALPLLTACPWASAAATSIPALCSI